MCLQINKRLTRDKKATRLIIDSHRSNTQAVRSEIAINQGVFGFRERRSRDLDVLEHRYHRATNITAVKSPKFDLEIEGHELVISLKIGWRTFLVNLHNLNKEMVPLGQAVLLWYSSKTDYRI